ncbi:MAG: hypothetical protein V7629_15775 [Motiliproteus sp.]
MRVKWVKHILAWVCVVLATTLSAQEAQTISDTEMALGYYKPLAEQGGAYAQLTIGEIYMEGSGVDKNLVQAYAWFAVAVHQGVDEVEELMKHVFKQLSEAEQVQARKTAELYIKNFSAPQ